LKKVLIITYYWPPTGGPGVLRWLKFVKYLPDNGWKPYVYTPLNPQAVILDNSLEKNIPQEAVVLKRKIIEPHNLFYFINKNKNVAPGFLQEQKSESNLFAIAKWVRGNIFVPDSRIFWVNPSVRYLEKIIKQENIKLVISTGPPHSMHLIALKLKQKLNIKWIADFRDPWTGIDFYHQLNVSKWADLKNKKLEAIVLKNADTVIAVGETLKNELVGLGAKDCVVITNGYDKDDFAQEENRVEKTDDKFVITYTGALNVDRNPLAFWNALKKLLEIYPDIAKILRVKIIGTTDFRVKEIIEQLQLLTIVEYVNQLSYKDSVAAQQQSDALLLVINNTPNAKGILTGKFFEYLSSGKFIIGIGPKDGDVAKILMETKAGKIFDYNETEEIYKTLEQIVVKKISENNKDKSLVELYERKSLTQKLSQLLNKLYE
jgi:glycosyltransferase involved in cell wall biosynthesis